MTPAQLLKARKTVRSKLIAGREPDSLTLLGPLECEVVLEWLTEVHALRWRSSDARSSGSVTSRSDRAG